MSKGLFFQGQSLFDKTIESTGDIEESFAVALLNGASVTDNFEIGAEVIFLEVKKKSIVALFHAKNRPASELLMQDLDLPIRRGIGTMTVGSTFIVG